MPPKVVVVDSWYDAGTRLKSAGDPSQGWGLGGGKGGPHPMRGPWPKAAKREEWVAEDELAAAGSN